MPDCEELGGFTQRSECYFLKLNGEKVVQFEIVYQGKKNLFERLRKRKHLNRYDKFKYSFYQKVQRGYLKLANNKKKYLVVNSDFSINYNKKIIENKINQLLKI